MKHAVLIALGLVLFGVFSSFYVVPEAQQALLLRFGRPIAVESQAGLYMKIPFVDDVTLYDMRLLSLAPPTEHIILGDQKRLDVDTFTEFRIVDALQFNRSVLTIEQARANLTELVGSSLRRVLGQVSLLSLLSPERDTIIANIRRYVAEAARPLGIEVMEVHLRRADLPAETSQAIYDRMTSERQREAKELRAQGYEWAQAIQAQADRDRTVLLSQAQLKGRILRSEGDSEASRMFKDAFTRDASFYAFYRAMQTYRHALADAAPTLVLSPKSDLLKYFATPTPASVVP